MHASINGVIVGLDNGSSPVRCQAIIYNNVGFGLPGYSQNPSFQPTEVAWTLEQYVIASYTM